MLLDGVLGVFSPYQIAAPVLLMLVAVGAEEPNDLLIHTLSVPIGLGVIPGHEADVNLQGVEEGCPDSGDKLRASIGDDVLREAVKTKYQIAQEFCCL